MNYYPYVIIQCAPSYLRNEAWNVGVLLWEPEKRVAHIQVDCDALVRAWRDWSLSHTLSIQDDAACLAEHLAERLTTWLPTGEFSEAMTNWLKDPHLPHFSRIRFRPDRFGQHENPFASLGADSPLDALDQMIKTDVAIGPKMRRFEDEEFNGGHVYLRVDFDRPRVEATQRQDYHDLVEVRAELNKEVPRRESLLKNMVIMYGDHSHNTCHDAIQKLSAVIGEYERELGITA